jgi:hypothetical protein
VKILKPLGNSWCITLVTLTAVSIAHPTLATHAIVKPSLLDLSDLYDYIIIGGGTSGLTVANRLTEDPTSKHAHYILLAKSITISHRNNTETVLVIKPGDFADEPCTWMPKNNVNISATPCRAHVLNISAKPIEGLNGFVLERFSVGMAVGGRQLLMVRLCFNEGRKDWLRE